MRRRRKAPASISEVLGKTANSLNISGAVHIHRLCKSWNAIVGSPISGHSCPLKIRGKTLILRVDHPALMQELTFLKPRLLEKIQSAIAGPKIMEIRFELGELPEAFQDSTREDTTAKPKTLTNDQKEFIERAAEQIGDDEIREAARRAMSKDFFNR